MSPTNEKVYTHYLECRAVGHFPDDPVVRRNAALIRVVEDQLADEKQCNFLNSMMLAAKR